METKALSEKMKIISDGCKTSLVFGDYELIGIRDIEFTQRIDEIPIIKLELAILPFGNIRVIPKGQEW